MRRAVVVFPLPRGPAKRYACATRFLATACSRVERIGSWPTRSAKRWGRYLRARARWDTRAPNVARIPARCGAKGPPGAGSSQLSPRHIEVTADRCYLPVLTGFAILDCAGTGRQHQATRRPEPYLRGLTAIARVSYIVNYIMVEMTGIEPVTS